MDMVRTVAALDLIDGNTVHNNENPLGPGVLAPTYGSLGTSVTTATEIVNARLGDNRGEHAAYLGPPNRVPSVRV